VDEGKTKEKMADQDNKQSANERETNSGNAFTDYNAGALYRGCKKTFDYECLA
jgi:hypothetical protein